MKEKNTNQRHATKRQKHKQYQRRMIVNLDDEEVYDDVESNVYIDAAGELSSGTKPWYDG